MELNYKEEDSPNLKNVNSIFQFIFVILVIVKILLISRQIEFEIKQRGSPQKEKSNQHHSQKKKK